MTTLWSSSRRQHSWEHERKLRAVLAACSHKKSGDEQKCLDWRALLLTVHDSKGERRREDNGVRCSEVSESIPSPALVRSTLFHGLVDVLP